LICKLFRFNKDKKCFFGLSLLFSVLLGFVIPSMSYIFSKIYTSLFKISSPETFDDGLDLRKSSLLIFLFLSFGYFLLSFFQILTSFILGSETTKNIRINVYDKLLRLPVSWFERK
jgi:ABC-type multidrug transport system fused ATPase/permease subunit